jgi:hypothetical protein
MGLAGLSPSPKVLHGAWWLDHADVRVVGQSPAEWGPESQHCSCPKMHGQTVRYGGKKVVGCGYCTVLQCAASQVSCLLLSLSLSSTQSPPFKTIVEDLCRLFPRVAMHGKCPAPPAMAFGVPSWSAGGGSGTALLPDISYVGQLPSKRDPDTIRSRRPAKRICSYFCFF